MRRTRLSSMLGAALLVALLLPQAALAAPTTTPPLAEIKLGCALHVPNPLSSIAPNRAIVCRWTAPEGVTVKAYRLWRSVDAGDRHLVARIPGDGLLRFADRNIRTGHAYHYRVIGIGEDGARVAKSDVDTVRVPRAPQALAFNCVVVIDGGDTSARCHWSDTTRPAAVRYVLWRSVDGGPREAIYRVGEDGRRSYVDHDVKPGQTIRYAVVALAKHGRIVAFGGPDRVVIPD
ncbi:MAG TPA: hypothetical protein VIF84_00185 [Candidatus Limnocylindrales bacterium]